MNYSVPLNAVESLHEIKKSRFIGRAEYVANREDAMTMLARVKQQHPDARHHCWAYQLGDPLTPYSAAMSDDGEPSGTAGKPILNVIQHKLIGDIMVIVTRYSGGIKLGAGGLVRAYSTSTQLTIQALALKILVATTTFQLQIPFNQEPSVRNWLTGNDGEIRHCDYHSSVIMEVAIPSEYHLSFTAFCANKKIIIQSTE